MLKFLQSALASGASWLRVTSERGVLTAVLNGASQSQALPHLEGAPETRSAQAGENRREAAAQRR
jgi:hypothetical protein